MFNKFNSIIVLLITLVISGCNSGTNKFNAEINLMDPHSYSNFDEVRVKHLDLDLSIDFDSKRIHGSIDLHIENITGTDKLILDTKSLSINKIYSNDSDSIRPYAFSKYHPVLGEALKIKITPNTKVVTIEYSTTDKADALLWLKPPEATNLFVFSDVQPIMTRSWLPCQDSPGVRQTYTARIKSMPGLNVVMSGKNSTEKSEDGIYEITMDQPVPSYLIAIASGDLEYRSLGPRSGVFAENDIIEQSASEFEDAELMMDAIESLYGPYRWDDYNVLTMPRAYAMGGMENPRINFVTPTLITGDKSLLRTLAHEIAHSWSGNLVTNQNWNDLWLNEGFTRYVEYRVLEEIYGKDFAEMVIVLHRQKLRSRIESLADRKELTKLHLDLKGIDPEVNSGYVAYEKGANFLLLCEETFGRDKWDEFLKVYFDKFAFQTMTSDKFVEYLRSTLVKGETDLENKLKIDEWVYGTGLPDNMTVVTSRYLEQVDTELNKWLNGTAAADLDTHSWTGYHFIRFINGAGWDFTSSQMTELDRAFNFTNTTNAELLVVWLQRTIHNGYEPADERLEEFLNNVGRSKFLRPLYSKLSESEEGFQRAKEIYADARAIYHSTARAAVEKILTEKENN